MQVSDSSLPELFHSRAVFSNLPIMKTARNVFVIKNKEWQPDPESGEMVLVTVYKTRLVSTITNWELNPNYTNHNRLWVHLVPQMAGNDFFVSFEGNPVIHQEITTKTGEVPIVVDLVVPKVDVVKPTDSDTLPIKRGRGRPKKIVDLVVPKVDVVNPTDSDTLPIKRGRGRPKKI